jgi:hypothetical protein
MALVPPVIDDRVHALAGHARRWLAALPHRLLLHVVDEGSDALTLPRFRQALPADDERR